MLFVFLSCKDPVDQAAKKRIFSAEDPPQAVAAATEKLPPENVAAKPEVARRVLGMGAAEATERIGPHEYKASILWDWQIAEQPDIKLKETRSLSAGPGGVSGDFIARLFNERNAGLEVIRVNNQVFARSTYGSDGAAKFRERKRDRGMAERSREEAYGALRDYDALFLGRMKLSEAGTSLIDGRTAWKYTVTLTDKAPSAAKLPPIAVPKNGIDETTKRRLHFFEARIPKSLEGEVFVDADTSVVLRARLDGRMTVKGTEGDAELRLLLESSLSSIGANPGVKVPAEFLPDEDKPQGIAAAMERFGIERQIPDAGPRPTGVGKKPTTSPDEPQDEQE